MARRPLAPDIWEQALVNGRRIHPGDDAAALSWSEAWYHSQGGRFDGEVEPAGDDPLLPVENTMPDAEFEALVLQSDHAPGPAEVEESKPAAKPKRRARQSGGQFKGDDPATPEVNEAWEGGDAA